MSCRCRRGFLVGLLGGLIALVSPAVACAATRGKNWGHVAGHRCPACGVTVVEVYSFRRDGGHYHRHSSNWWFHYDGGR